MTQKGWYAVKQLTNQSLVCTQLNSFKCSYQTVIIVFNIKTVKCLQVNL